MGISDAMDEASQLTEAVDSLDLPSALVLLLNDTSTIAGVVHANGFHKLTFPQGRATSVLRLHIWMPDRNYGKVPGNIHNHRWSFVSKIFAGAMTTTSFVPSASDGRTYHHYLYDPEAESGMLHLGCAMLKRREARTFRAGERYFVDSEVVHQAEPLGSQPTVTLIARSASKKKVADVYATQHLSKIVNDAAALTEAQIRRDLLYVYQLISAASP